MRARAVISDFGGVLTVPLIDAFAHYQRRSGVSPAHLGQALQAATEAGGGANPLYALERGEISEDEFNRRLDAHLPGDMSLAAFRDAWFEALHPNEPLIDYMRDLRSRGIRLALLTNNVREWEPHWRAKLPVDEIFEVVVDSAFVGMRKPDPEIYRLTLERLGGGLEFEDCVFVDDLEPNVRAARDLGMDGILFETTVKAIADIEAALGAGSASRG